LSKKNKEGPKFTDAHKKQILERFENNESPPGLKELIFDLTGDAFLDGRSKFGKSVAKYLGDMGKEYVPAQIYRKTPRKALTEEQKTFIINNYDPISVNAMTPTDMARVIFDDPKLTQVHTETKSIAEFISTLGAPLPNHHIRGAEYAPPRSPREVLKKINTYVTDAKLQSDKLDEAQKICINKTLHYLNTYRFNNIINGYSSQDSRDLLESTFIRYTWNKPDLLEEEVDQFVSASIEMVIASDNLRRQDVLNQRLDGVVEDPDGRISMALSDVIGKITTEYNQHRTRSSTLYKDLNNKRSDRIKRQIQENKSLVQLVQYWREEGNRQRMLDLAEARKKQLKDELGRLKGLDDLKLQVWGGPSDNELLDGL